MAEADFFYVPLMLSLGFMTHRFGICSTPPPWPGSPTGPNSDPNSDPDPCHGHGPHPNLHPGIYLPSATSAKLINDTIQYISHAFPYWNRTDGADHLLPFTGVPVAHVPSQSNLRSRHPLLSIHPRLSPAVCEVLALY